MTTQQKLRQSQLFPEQIKNFLEELLETNQLKSSSIQKLEIMLDEEIVAVRKLDEKRKNLLIKLKEDNK